MKELFILSGPSGSGVSSSKFVFEELGFYVIDNAPSSVTQPILDEYANKKSMKGVCLMPRINGAKKVLDIATNISAGIKITDSQSGFRAFSSNAKFCFRFKNRCKSR